jgi:hypothetical protein
VSSDLAIAMLSLPEAGQGAVAVERSVGLLREVMAAFEAAGEQRDLAVTRDRLAHAVAELGARRNERGTLEEARAVAVTAAADYAAEGDEDGRRRMETLVGRIEARLH